MLLSLDGWIYNKISTALGASARLDYWYPNDFIHLPAVAYHTSQRNSTMDYQDDMAIYSDCAVEFDLYVKNNQDDSAIALIIANTMAGLYFNLDSSIPIPDPDAKTVHRNMQFSRAGMSAIDLV